MSQRYCYFQYTYTDKIQIVCLPLSYYNLFKIKLKLLNYKNKMIEWSSILGLDIDEENNDDKK